MSGVKVNRGFYLIKQGTTTIGYVNRNRGKWKAKSEKIQVYGDSYSEVIQKFSEKYY